MPLQRGEVRGYDFDRMIVEFMMLNQGKVIMCAISTAAMDDIEGRRDVRPDQRVDQFMRETGSDAGAYYMLEHTPEDVTVAEPLVARTRERRMIRDLVLDPQNQR
jgi:hypothetical protein